MHRPHIRTRLLPRFLASALIASFVIASVPPQQPQQGLSVLERTDSPARNDLQGLSVPGRTDSPARNDLQGLSVPGRTDSPAHDDQQGLSVLGRTDSPAHSPANVGALLFAAAVDADDNAASNPTATTPVPVHRFGGPHIAGQADDAARYAVIALAVEVTPDEATHNPAGAMVEFRLWDDAGQVNLVQRARADAWGAAAAEFFLDDLHLAGQFHYSARADGYRETPARSFVFDPASYASDVQLGAARVTTQVGTDGRLVVDVESDAAIDDSALAVQLTAVRLLPTASGAPDKALLPPLAARRLDEHHARAEIYLEAGDYLISASAQSGVVEARSQPAYVQIARVDAPAIAAVENLTEFSEDGETVLVQYRTPDGDAALLRRKVTDLPDEPPQPATPPLFQQRTRIAPFQWRTQVYSTTVETVVDDGKKLATLDGFTYDPIARTYDIKIESLMDEAVEDKLTVQVFGPNRVVIYEETVPIWLDPAQPFHTQFSLPSDLGEPYGLRIRVHDPLDFDWALSLISDAVATVYNTLDAAVNKNRDGFVLTAGFGFSLKVVEIDVITASISCASGECKPKPLTGVFFGADPWLGVVTDGVKTFLRNQYRDVLATDDMDAILKKLGEGINLGALTLSATASARYIYTLIDPASCVNAQALEQAKKYVADLGFAAKDLGDTITFRAKNLSESLQSKGRINLAIPGTWFLGAQLSPVLAFKLKGDKSGDYAIYGELQVELGGKATLKLKASAIFDSIFALLAAKEYVIGIYRILDIARTGQKLFTMISSASAYAAGGGCSAPKGGGGGGKNGPNPPPPNGAPDDRIDAFQNQFVPDPRGIGGDIQSLQQQIAAARSAGLTRAVTYFTVQLRRQELAAFELDTSRTISHTAELDAVYDQAYLRLTGLISGTVLPDPGQTITDAVRSTYTDYLIGITQTDYSQERRGLLDSLEFAQRQYSLLRGQELELQHELSLLNAAGGVGVMDSGLVTDALGALGSLGIRAVPLEVVAGAGSSGLPTSRYLTPSQAPHVVVVPSGGLNRFRESNEARAWLETYVAIGGTLIVLAQFDSGDWEMLPGGQVRGLGYQQDILCKTASVRIVNSSPWIVGIGRDRPDIQIDGSFTDWPGNATVVLMRTTGNQMPAMIEYPYGLGQVVATSAYPDFYMNGMQSEEDMVFARSLFGQAWLQATGETLAGSVTPHQTLSASIDLANTSIYTATELSVWSDYYERRLGDSWRWAAHAPRSADVAQVIPLTPPLASGGTRSLSISFSAPERPGIYRSGYFLGALTAVGNLWNVTGVLPGVFYQVRSPAVKTDLFRFQLAADQPAYDFGATATLTATIANDRASARTFTLQPVSGLNAAPVVLVVGPHSAASQTYTTVVDGARQVRLAAMESGATVSELVTTLRLKLPTLGVSGTPQEALAGIAATGVFSAVVSNTPPGTTTVDWEVRQDGALLTAASTALVGTGGSSLAELTAALPAAAPGSQFTVAAALPNTPRVMTQTIPVLGPIAIRSVLLTESPVIDDPNQDRLLVGLQDPGYPGQFTLQALLKDDSGVISSSALATGSIGSGVGAELLDLPLPAALTLGMTYTVAISATGQFAGAAASYQDFYSMTLPLAAPQTSLSDASRTAGQPLAISVRPLPDNVALPAAGPYDVLLQGASTYEWLPVDAITPDGAGVVLHTRVPYYLYEGGQFDVQVTSPRLLNWQSHNSLAVPPHRISIDSPTSVLAGQPLTVTLQNSGGITTTVYGDVMLLDRRTERMAEMSFYLTVPAGGDASVALPLPSQLKTGFYTLRVQGYDHLSQPVGISRPVSVAGLSVDLDSRTDAPAYLASDLIATTSTITPNAALTGAMLRLRVLGTPPPPTGWDGWRAPLADGGFSNYVSQIAAGPFIPGWNATPDINVTPLAIDGQVIVPSGNCADPRVSSLDSVDGSLSWQSEPLPQFANGLAAAGQYIYVYTSSTCPPGEAQTAAPETGFNHLVALDSDSGALVWTISLDSNGALAASDAAVAIHHDYNADSYLLLDPATGITITQVSTVTDALLVGSNFYVHDGDNLAAYDAASGNQLWTASGSYLIDSNLLAANGSRVLTLQSYDPVTFDLVNRLSVFAGDGSHVGDIELAQGPYAFSAILADNTLYYLYVDTGGSTRTPEDIVTTVYAVDLAGFSESVFYTSENEVVAMVGTGDRIHLLDGTDQMLISLDENGAVIGQSDLSALGGGGIDRLTVYQQGLLALEYGGYTVHALQGSGPVYDGGGERPHTIESTSVMREEWLPVDGNGVLSLPLPLINPDLGDDPRARGLLYLEGVLFGAEPADASPGNRQPLASSVYPFTVDNAATSVNLKTDQPTYRYNLPGYAGDDALGAATLSGQIRNTTLTPDDIDLQIVRSDGATILAQTFSGVAVNETRPFSVVDLTPPPGATTYTATTSLGDQAVVSVLVQPGQVSATSSLATGELPGQIVLGEAATIQALLTNLGTQTGVATADLGDGPQVVMLAAGEGVTLTRTLTPTASGELSLPISFSGDVSRTDVLSLTVRDETATASINLTGTLRTVVAATSAAAPGRGPVSTALVQGADAGLELSLQNDQPFSFDVVVDYTLTGPVALSGSELATLPPGPTAIQITLGALPVGDYAALLTVRHARLGTVVASAALSFSVVSPIYDLDVTASAAAPDAQGEILLQVTASSAAGSEQPWTGTLVIEDNGDVARREPLALLPGDSAGFSETLSLRDRAGPQVVRALLIGPDGAVVAEQELAIAGPPRLAPAALLTGLTASPGSPGGPLTLTAAVDNDGPAGDVALSFTAFDQTYEVTSALPAYGQRAVTLTVTAPAGLLAGSYPAAVHLAGQSAKTEVVLSGAQIDLEQSLNQAGYQPNTPATWTVSLHGVSGGPASYDVAFRYVTQSFTETVTLGAGQTVDVPWTFDVGPASARATVIVQPHLSSAADTRYALIIDSRWIPVIEDPYAWLESDKPSYTAGETVHLTMHLIQPTDAAYVLAPDAIPSTGSPLLWTNLSMTSTYTATNLYTTGDFDFDYTLPATLRTGRYHFVYAYDTEERTLPIDVHGVDLFTEEFAVTVPAAGQPLQPGDPLTVTAILRLDAPLGPVTLLAYGQAPDGSPVNLGPQATQTVSLPAGRTPIALPGVLPVAIHGPLAAFQPGAYQVVLKVLDPDTQAVLGGDAAFVDVGKAVISDLFTDHGLYTPGQPGTGTVVVYGSDNANVLVTTSGGTELLNQNLALSGFTSLDFTLPTATAGDEVLIGTVTDSDGLTSTLQSAYKVAASLDATPPEVKALSPAQGAAVTLDGSHLIAVSGVFTEETAIDAVLVNGDPAALAGNTWTAAVPAELGSNLIQVVALDAAGNVSAPDLLDVYGEPEFGISFTVIPTTTTVNTPVYYSAVVTSSEPLTASVLFPFSVKAVNPMSGSATTGTLTLDAPVAWEGIVLPGEPVTIQWQGLATAPISRTVSALVQGQQVMPRFSQDIDTEITTAPLSVILADFQAQGGASAISLTWETVSEIDNAGFNLYRRRASAGERELLAFIPSAAPGSSFGAVYQWTDSDVQPGIAYDYWLQAIDFAGQSAWFGPVSATAQTPTAVRLNGLTAEAWALPAGLPVAPLPAQGLLLAGLAGMAAGLAALRRRRR